MCCRIDSVVLNLISVPEIYFPGLDDVAVETNFCSDPYNDSVSTICTSRLLEHVDL